MDLRTAAATLWRIPVSLATTDELAQESVTGSVYFPVSLSVRFGQAGTRYFSGIRNRSNSLEFMFRGRKSLQTRSSTILGSRGQR
jgi:hypothetical protein